MTTDAASPRPAARRHPTLSAAVLTALTQSVALAWAHVFRGPSALHRGALWYTVEVVGLFALYWLACTLVVRAVERAQAGQPTRWWNREIAIGVAFVLAIFFHWGMTMSVWMIVPRLMGRH